MKIEIENDLSFCENWYRGNIIDEENQYPFWLIENVEDNRVYYDVRWFYKTVPREVRKLSSDIIVSFEKRKNYESTFFSNI